MSRSFVNEGEDQINYYLVETKSNNLFLYLRSRLGMLLPEKYESIFDVSSEGPSSGSLACLLNFPTKGLRSKRRRYFHIFQVEAYLTYCEDIYEVSTYTGSCCS